MALSRTDFGPYFHDNTGFVAQGTDPFVTDPFTPPADCVLLVGVSCGAEPAEIIGGAEITVEDGTNTYTLINFAGASFGADGLFNLIFYTEIGSSPSEISLTIDKDGMNSYAFKVVVAAFTGYNTSDPIGGHDSDTNNSTTNTLTLSEAPAAEDVVWGLIGLVGSDQNASDVTISPGASGGSQITNDVSPDSFVRVQTQARTGSTSTTFDWSTSTTASSPFFNRPFVAVTVKAQPDPSIEADGLGITVALADVGLHAGFTLVAEPLAVEIDFADAGLAVGKGIIAEGLEVRIALGDVNFTQGLVMATSGLAISIALGAATLTKRPAWVAGNPTTGNWTEQSSSSDGWVEQGPLTGSWLEES